MQKKLVALAITSLISMPVLAQSSVTVYGQMDIGVMSVPGDGDNNVTRIDSANWADSYFGVKGSEDLGNGLKAVFQVETELVNDDATGLGGKGRDTFVGLSGNFGTLIAGRLSTPLNNWVGDYDPSGANAFRTNNVNLTGSLELEDRANNTLAYAAPDMGGLSAVLFYSVDERTKKDRTDEKTDIVAKKTPLYGVGLRYDNDALSVMYTYHAKKNVVDNHALGLSYDFGMARVTGSYIFNQFDNNKLEDEQGWNVGVAVPVGNGAVTLGYGQESNIGGTKDKDNKIAALTYSYNLSKRTSLYAGYRYQKPNKGGDNTNEYGVGLVHSF